MGRPASRQEILAEGNRKRDRRTCFLIALITQGLFGAFTMKYSGSGAAFLLSAAIKLVVTTMFLFNKSCPRALDSDERRSIIAEIR